MSDDRVEPSVIAEMVAEREIMKVLMRYCRAIDRCDEELLRSVYHDDAWDDHGGVFRGYAKDFIEPVMSMLRRRFLSTMHTLRNISIDVDGDNARAESYCIAYHACQVPDGKDPVLELFACRYADRFEWRPEAGWRIADRVVIREWQQRLPMVSEEDQPPGFVAAHRDRTDVVFLDELPRRLPT